MKRPNRVLLGWQESDRYYLRLNPFCSIFFYRNSKRWHNCYSGRTNWHNWCRFPPDLGRRGTEGRTNTSLVAFNLTIFSGLFQFQSCTFLHRAMSSEGISFRCWFIKSFEWFIRMRENIFPTIFELVTRLKIISLCPSDRYSCSTSNQCILLCLPILTVCFPTYIFRTILKLHLPCHFQSSTPPSWTSRNSFLAPNRTVSDIPQLPYPKVFSQHSYSPFIRTISPTLSSYLDHFPSSHLENTLPISQNVLLLVHDLVNRWEEWLVPDDIQ